MPGIKVELGGKFRVPAAFAEVFPGLFPVTPDLWVLLPDVRGVTLARAKLHRAFGV